MKKKLFWKAMAIVAVVAFVVVALAGVLFVRVVEANLAEEIGKWLVMDIFITAVVCVIAYAPVGAWANRKAAELEKKDEE